ncbi:MAG TPA: hypothetical protein VFC89_02820 [Oscillospiraceae bacterium]|nr:hypothetical protein [Oscillospiraceae bacterium]
MSNIKTRKVEFYSIKYKWSGQRSLYYEEREIHSDEIYPHMVMAICNYCNTTGEIPINLEKDVFLQIYETNDCTLFGIIGTSKKFENDILQRIRENDPSASEDNYKEILDNLRLDLYTYFLVDLHKRRAVVLVNDKTPSFRKHFRIFMQDTLNREHCLLEKDDELYLENLLDEKYEQKLQNLTSLLEVSMTFDSQSDIGSEMLNFKDAFALSQQDLKQATVKLQMESKVIPSRLIEKAKDKKRMDENFKTFHLKGTIEEDGQEKEVILDAIKQYLTANVSIVLSEQSLINQSLRDEIKDALISELQKII